MTNVYANNLGNDFATFLYKHVITDMEVKTTNEVFVIEGRTLHGSACKQNGFHVGDGRYGSCAPHLERNLVETGTNTLGLKLVSDGPTWAFGGKAKLLLLAQAVYFEHNTIGGYGQIVARGVPMVDKCVYLF